MKTFIGAIDRFVQGPTEVVIVADDADDTEPLLTAARRAYVPNLALARVGGNAG